MKSLAIIDDDFDIRKSVRASLESSNKILIDFESDSVEKTILYYRTRQAPDLMLLDISLPGISGLDGLPRMKRLFPETHIIMFTILEDEDKVFQAICNGASGYLLKNTPYDELEKLLLITAEEGGSVISPAIARRILNYFSIGNRKSRIKESDQLSDTEHTIINLLVEGLSYQQVSEMLGMTINGIRYYIKRIYQKLQINSRSQLIKHVLDQQKESR